MALGPSCHCPRSHGSRPPGSSRLRPMSSVDAATTPSRGRELLGHRSLPLPWRVLLESVGRDGAWQQVTGWGAWLAAVTWWPTWRHRDQIRFFRLTQRSSRGLARVGARCQGCRAGVLLCPPQRAGSVPAATGTLMRLSGASRHPQALTPRHPGLLSPRKTLGWSWPPKLAGGPETNMPQTVTLPPSEQGV